MSEPANIHTVTLDTLLEMFNVQNKQIAIITEILVDLEEDVRELQRANEKVY